MWQALHFEFMRNALIAGTMVSIICGVVGTLVVVNRLVFLSGGIAHAAYGGIGLAVYFGFSPGFFTAGFASAVALVMGAITVKDKHRADAAIGALWAIGMALGIILVSLTPGYNVDLMGYLFGSILTVVKSDIWMMIALNVVILLVVLLFYKEFIAISYDEEFAFVVGIPVTLFYFILLLMTSLAVVVTIKVVGLILVIALLSIPPSIAEDYTHSLGGMMFMASLFGIFFTVCGLYLSFNYNLPSGAAIIMVAGAVFFLSKILRWIGRRSVSPSSMYDKEKEPLQ